MTRRIRRRRILKWIGCLVCALLVLVWLPNGQTIRYVKREFSFWHPGMVYRGYWIGDGGAGYIGYISYKPPAGFSIGRPFCGRDLPVGASCDSLGTRLWYFPAWIPLAFAGPLTVLLFILDRLSPPGKCRECGYDLTGNVSGVCPECGSPVSSTISHL